MLLRFSTENHLSMRDRQELSLAASSLKDNEAGLIDCAVAPNGRVLPAAVIYGANASGKSNLVRALEYMRSAILFSHSKGEPGEDVPRTPFALDPKCSEAPSAFDMDFVTDGVRYNYGFEASSKIFNAEWLYVFHENYRRTLFERKDKNFKFGRELKGRNKVISDLTRPNSLFVSAAAQNDHNQLSKIAGFFRSLRVDTEISVAGIIASFTLEENELDSRVIEFLDKIGTGVTGFRRQEKEIEEEQVILRRGLASLFEKAIKKPVELDLVKNGKDIATELAHRGRDGEPVFFNLDRESAGTRRLLLLLGRIFRVLDEGAVMVIDELDASLHTHACEEVLALFSSPATNPKGAQIIATTHDTNLLHSQFLRRDQVWFAEKDEEGATHLYPLTDIRTRKGDNIAKGYLQGRFGAVPFPGSAAARVAAG